MRTITPLIVFVPFDDKKTYDSISKGNTLGVFQLESGGMRKMLTAMRPFCLEDIILAISIYRPGPMQFIPTFIARKKGEEQIVYEHPKMEKYLAETYGIMLYQEQIMQVVQALAGFSLGGADILRRAIGKKKEDVMKQQREKFIEGCKEASDIPADLADKILTAWRGYSDLDSSVIAFSDGEPHNTITPIARRRSDLYELDLVLRCNITTEEHPLGVFHPHADKHHIKKENIGLIEVMGLAVLPSRLKKELNALAEALVSGAELNGDLAKHAAWAEGLKTQYTFTAENALDILLLETGKTFAGCLEDAGVYKCTEEGRAGFLRFAQTVK